MIPPPNQSSELIAIIPNLSNITAAGDLGVREYLSPFPG